MLYTGYEINRTMLATMGRVAQFNSELLLNRANPWSYHVASPQAARALEVFAHAAAPRGKPDFGLTMTIIDGAEIEIWQCDVLAAYRHPSVRQVAGSYDEAFQGFGASRSGRDGQARFRSIRPVPYPGRTPHIHIKLRQPSFGEVTSQLFIAGDPGNARDFLWRGLAPADRDMLEMTLVPAAPDTGLRWQVQQTLVLPA